MKLKWILLSVLCFGLTNFCKAQQPENKKDIELYLPILSDFSLKKGEVSVFLENVKGVSVKVGMSVNAYQRGIYSDDPDEITRDFRLVGTGRIQQISDTLIGCYIKLNNHEDSLSAGDVISFQTEVSDPGFESIFSKLAFRNLFFKTLNQKYFYTLQDLILRDSPQLEEMILSAMLEDIKTGYNYLKDNPATVFTTSATSGRFAGKTPMETLSNFDKKGLKAFLEYANSYDLFIGLDYTLFQSIVGWLYTNSPFSDLEVKEALLPIFRNKKVFEDSIKKYVYEIKDARMSETFSTEALKLSGSGNFHKAKELADFAKALAIYTRDSSAHIFSHIARSEIFQNQQIYLEAIKEIDTAILLSQKIQHINYEVQSLRKKALLLSNLFQLPEAKAYILKAIELLDKNSAYFDEMDLITHKKNNSIIYANIENDEGEYASALQKYKAAIRLNEQINSYASMEENALFGHAMGEILNGQGKPNEALIEMNKAMEVYKKNKNKLKTGEVQNEMAYSYYLAGNYVEALKFCNEAFENLKDENLNSAGYSKSLRGSVFWEMGFYESAIQSHNESITLRRISNNYDGQADSWKQIGKLYRLSGYKNEALKAYDSSLYYYKKINFSIRLAEVYNEKGEVFLNDENFKQAIVHFDSARGVSIKTTVETFFKLGAAWENIDVEKATEYYTACQALSDSTQNIHYLFTANSSLSKLAFRSQDTVVAEQYYKISQKIATEINTPIYEARVFSLKAFGYRYKIKLDSAIYYYEKAADIFKEVSMSEYFWQKMNIASIEREMGNFKNSEELLINLENLARENNYQIALGSVFSDLTFLYSLTGEFSKGNSCKDSAIAVFKYSGNHVRLAHAYSSAGTLLKNMGKFREAIYLDLIADSIYKTEHLKEPRSIILNNIGTTYIAQGNYRKALDYFQQSEKLEGSKDLNEENLFYKSNIAECYYYLEKYDSALAIFLKVFPFAREKRLERIASGIALGLGKTYLNTKEFDKAQEYFQYAKTFSESSKEKRKLIESLISLGELAIQKNDSLKAESWFRSAVDHTGSAIIAGGWEPFYKLGLLYFHRSQFDTSIIYLRKAADLLQLASENIYGGEDAHKIFDNDPNKLDLFSKITFAYYNVGNLEEAWAFANKSNIAGLKELSGPLTDQSGPEIKEVLAKVAKMQESKKALEAAATLQTGKTQQAILEKIEILEKDYTNFLADISVKYSQLSPYFVDSDAKRFYRYKGELPDDVAVVLYITNDKTLMIFTLTNELLSVDTMSLDIVRDVNTFIRATKQPGISSGTGPLHTRSEAVDEDDPLENIAFKDISEKLYTILIGSIRDKIKTKKKLCIIPSGIFSNMPFQCLGEKKPDSSFHFLLEDFAIFYANEMRVFGIPSKEDKHKDFYKSFAAFGVPDKTLRFNITEVKSIGKIIGADESFIYTDKRATENLAIKSLETKRYIHFATHGELVYSSAFSESYLKFLPDAGSPGSGDGKLTIRKINTLEIKDCDLVILSACETGISKQLVKGWNISPANSFLERRVKSVIASLWKVDDEATSILMNHFYSNLNKKMDLVQALRLAQESLSKNPKFAHPFYWGAFVLYGDWR